MSVLIVIAVVGCVQMPLVAFFRSGRFVTRSMLLERLSIVLIYLADFRNKLKSIDRLSGEE